MRPIKKLESIVFENKKSNENKENQKKLEAENKAKELNLAEKEKEANLNAKKRELDEKELGFLSNQYESLEESMHNLSNVIHINFNSAFELSSVKYDALKRHTEEVRREMLEARKETLTLKTISILKLCAALLITFIVVRVVSDNETLLESMTYITPFALLLDNFTGTVLDFVIQDFVLISACSFFISIVFAQSEFLQSKKVITHATIGLIIGISGLILSALLYTF